MQTKRNIFLWILYDFANSIISIVFFLYFTQWLVVEMGVKDIWFNLTFTVSSLLLLLSAPLAGLLADKFLSRLSGIRYTTTLTALLYTCCVVAIIQGSTIWAIIFFTLGLYAYQLSFIFYTPLLNDISTPKRRGLISGCGIAANYLGQFAGLVLVLPFANEKFSLFDIGARAETLLPAIIIFFILTLPMMIWFKEDAKDKLGLSVKTESKFLWQETKKLFIYPSIALFLVAYFFFNDAILTAANNFPIFLEQVWGASDNIKTYILLGILVTSALGGIISGWIADRFGHRRTLLVILAGWLVVLPMIGLVTNFTLFIIAATLMGFWFGASWTVSRSVMSYLVPPSAHNLAFSYFGLAERASSLVGPLVWGGVVSGFVHLGADRYRYATLAVSIFVLFGLIALTKVRDDRAIKPYAQI